jgi:hypothetical protein
MTMPTGVTLKGSLLIKHHATKTCGSGGIASTFLTSALDEGEWSASRPVRFTPGERAPGTHWFRSLGGPRASLDAVGGEKNVLPLLGLEPGRPAPVCRCTD